MESDFHSIKLLVHPDLPVNQKVESMVDHLADLIPPV